MGVVLVMSGGMQRRTKIVAAFSHPLVLPSACCVKSWMVQVRDRQKTQLIYRGFGGCQFPLTCSPFVPVIGIGFEAVVNFRDPRQLDELARVHWSTWLAKGQRVK